MDGFSVAYLYILLSCIIVFSAGLNLLPGSKRKLVVDTDGQCDGTPMSHENYATQDHLKPKRAKQMQVPKKYGCWDADFDTSVADGTVDSQADANRHNSLGCLQASPSACASLKALKVTSRSVAVFSLIRRADFHTHNLSQVSKSLKYPT